jgi:hypothetical protein
MTYRLFFPTIASNAVIAQPSKRGLAGNPWSGRVPHGRDLGIAWAHSWNTWTGQRDGIDLVPMLWGWVGGKSPSDKTNYWKQFQQRVPLDYAGHVLFVNEPERHDQSNLTPAQAVALFEAAVGLYEQARWSSPQIGIWDERGWPWLESWWRQLPEWARERVDFWAVHLYKNDIKEHKAFVEAWAGYLRQFKDVPIWMTEWGIQERAHEDGGMKAVQQLAAFYDSHPSVARHAYFSNWLPESEWWAKPFADMALVDEHGLTPRGMGWLA